MGFFSSYEISGYGENGRFLGPCEKEAVQDWIIDEGFGECITDHSPDSFSIMSFNDTSFGAYNAARSALTDCTKLHRGITLELDYSDESEQHELMRFRDGEMEVVERVEFFPPFKVIRSGDQKHDAWPVLRFVFAADARCERATGTQLTVLLARRLSKNETDALDDSVAAYIDRLGNYSPAQLVDDVLNAANIDHWILEPAHTFIV